MRIRSALAIATLALAPAVALAAQPIAAQPVAAQPGAAGPLFVNVEGHVVPARAETHVVQTSAGPMKVSTWSWHGPGGVGTIQVQTTRGGPPPAWALQQMRDMNLQMRALQAQMQQIQQAAFMGVPTIGAPMTAMFAVPQWAVPVAPSSVPVIFVVPRGTKAPAAPAAPAHAAPGLKV